MTRKTATTWAARLGLMAFGLALGAGAIALALALFPSLVPQDLRDPLEREQAGQTMHVVYTEAMGDIFIHSPGQVAPPEDPAVLSEYTLRWNADGFRVPAQPADAYPIVALGDSFTEGWQYPLPWPDVVAEASGTPVENLGYRGYGPLEYREIMAEYGAAAPREWVLIGFFGGNDLQNIRTSTERGGLLDTLLREAIDPDDASTTPQTSPDGNYKFPLALYIGAGYYEQAFFEPYIWFLNGEAAVYAESRNMALWRETLAAIMDAAGDACVGVVYLPTKAEIYLPYAEPFGLRWVLETGSRQGLDPDGWISPSTMGDEVIAREELLGNMGYLRDALRTSVTDTGAHFIDLAPAFEAAAAEGEVLYPVYDTHFNAAGHRLAGETIAEYIAGVPGCGG